MLRDSAQLAEQANSIPHLNSLDFVMESLALGHTVMAHRFGGAGRAGVGGLGGWEEARGWGAAARAGGVSRR